uniref:hypothetical protein n=1 Tax=Anaerocolumna aminovalerica TaxID=1527 RepID=UPI001A9A60EF
AYLACPKTGIIDTNIKMVLNTVMEQDSENPTPKLDKEPKKELFLNSSILRTNSAEMNITLEESTFLIRFFT